MTENNQKTILIVEDEVSQLKALADQFGDEGFRVLQAQDGQEGLALALREHPDLILLDIVMPKMDGLAMLHKVREDQWGKNAQVIMLTNLSDNADIAKAMENETFDYLVKTDWKLEDVVLKIKERLSPKI